MISLTMPAIIGTITKTDHEYVAVKRKGKKVKYCYRGSSFDDLVQYLMIDGDFIDPVMTGLNEYEIKTVRSVSRTWKEQLYGNYISIHDDPVELNFGL